MHLFHDYLRGQLEDVESGIVVFYPMAGQLGEGGNHDN